jgi:small subunit ribosomal protein S6
VREFDTTFIIQPEISEDARETLIARLKGVLERAGAVPLEVDDIGKRKLAYEIKRFQKGHYLSLFYADSGKAVAELERALRLDESILRFLTVRRADDVGDLDARKVRAVEMEKVRHEKAAERATREAEERAAREAARLAGEPVDEGDGDTDDEEEEYGVRGREPRGRDDDDDEGDDRSPAGE